MSQACPPPTRRLRLALEPGQMHRPASGKSHRRNVGGSSGSLVHVPAWGTLRDLMRLSVVCHGDSTGLPIATYVVVMAFPGGHHERGAQATAHWGPRFFGATARMSTKELALLDDGVINRLTHGVKIGQYTLVFLEPIRGHADSGSKGRSPSTPFLHGKSPREAFDLAVSPSVFTTDEHLTGAQISHPRDGGTPFH